MKAIFAGTAGSSPNSFLFNCIRNKQCMKEYFIPVMNLSDIMLYLPLPTSASSLSVFLNTCDDRTEIEPCSWVIGQKPNLSYYAIVLLDSNNTIQGSFYIDITVGGYQFFSEQYIMNDCKSLTKIESCFNDAEEGSYPDMTDSSGIYYGYSAGSVSGNPSLRFIHKAYVRQGQVIGTGNKINLSFFNKNSAYKSTVTKQSTLKFETVPEFYADYLISVFSRGSITINGQKIYKLEESQNFSIIDDESRLWRVDVLLNETTKQFFNCISTPCILPECGEAPPPDEECCTPTGVSAILETVEIGD